jgi:pimeloyl-ACP methyl ester carboxylesterase
MEVIRFGEPNAKPPLLFIHGSYCGAWIWERHFLPAFAQEGWYGAAISLRGHGKSEGADKIDSFGIKEYLEDIKAGVALFDEPPVLIGHSLGGYMVQKYALELPVTAQILLSSPSLWGLASSAQHIAVCNPLLALELGKLMTLGQAFADGSVIANALFLHPQSPDSLKDDLCLLQRESSRFSMEASWPEWRLPKQAVPTLVIGGDHDAFIPTSDFRYSAAFWCGDLKILPDVPHGLMLDPCWPTVVKEMTVWLNKRFN